MTNLYSLASAYLVTAAVLLSAVTLAGLRDLLTPAPMVTTYQDAITACIQMSQERLKITHEQVQSADVLGMTEAPRRGVYFSIDYRADGRGYHCDLARGINGRWFLNSLYIVK